MDTAVKEPKLKLPFMIRYPPTSQKRAVLTRIKILLIKCTLPPKCWLSRKALFFFLKKSITLSSAHFSLPKLFIIFMFSKVSLRQA